MEGRNSSLRIADWLFLENEVVYQACAADADGARQDGAVAADLIKLIKSLWVRHGNVLQLHARLALDDPLVKHR